MPIRVRAAVRRTMQCTQGGCQRLVFRLTKTLDSCCYFRGRRNPIVKRQHLLDKAIGPGVARCVDYRLHLLRSGRLLSVHSRCISGKLLGFISAKSTCFVSGDRRPKLGVGKRKFGVYTGVYIRGEVGLVLREGGTGEHRETYKQFATSSHFSAPSRLRHAENAQIIAHLKHPATRFWVVWVVSSSFLGKFFIRVHEKVMGKAVRNDPNDPSKNLHVQRSTTCKKPWR
jgi:hypothetical protein